MRAYCVFDDFPEHEIERFEQAGIKVDVLERGKNRPDAGQMKAILENYDIVIIGTSQKINVDMWENVTTPRIIGTASVGVDHIKIPDGKDVAILNTPNANAQSVAEYIVGCALMCRKRLLEGNELYRVGKNNKALSKKPEDIHGTVIGIVGAGHIAEKVMQLLLPFGVEFLSHTMNPDRHRKLTDAYGVRFVSLDELTRRSDVVVVAVPNDASTQNLISSQIVAGLKKDSIFISVARSEVTDFYALLAKARENRNFYLCMDLDIKEPFIGKNERDNIIITPHIGGGTIETRKRMFAEVTDRIIRIVHERVGAKALWD